MTAVDDDFDRFFFDDPWDDDALFDEQSGRGVYISPRGLDAGIDPHDPVWRGTDGPIRVAEMTDDRLRNVIRWVERQDARVEMRDAWLRVLRAEAHKRPAFLLPDDPFRNITIEPPTQPEIDRPMSVNDALRAARDERFGDEQQPLESWLACEAFERRMDENACRALKAAARLVAAIMRRGV